MTLNLMHINKPISNMKNFKLNCLRLTILVIFFTLSSCNKNDPDKEPESEIPEPITLEFSDLSDLPEGCYGFGYCTDGANIYVVSGKTENGNSSKAYKYSLIDNTWSIVVNNLIPKVYCNAELVSGSLFALNGLGELGVNDKVENIFTSYGIIHGVFDNPYPAKYAGCCRNGNKIYHFGGWISDNNYSDKVVEYDVNSMTYKIVGNLPVARETSGRIVNDILYVIGGYNGEVSNLIHAFDLSTKIWTGFEMPVAISAHATAVDGDIIWIVGSYDQMDFIGSFNTKTEKFTVHQSVNFVPRRHCGCVVISGKLYVFGGNTSSSESYLSSVQVASVR